MKSSNTLNPILTGHAVQFMRDTAGFIGTRLAPVFSAGLQSAEYYVFKAADLIGAPTNIRHAPGAPFRRFIPSVSDDNYTCKDYGIEQPVPDEDRKKYASAFDADLAATRRLTDIITVNHELRVRNIVTATASVANAAPAALWSDAASNPKDDVTAGKEVIRKAIGLKANVMAMSQTVFNTLEVHPKIVELFKYTTPGVLKAAQLAAYFGIDQLLVAEAVQATNAEGQAVTADDIWGDTVVLAHVEPGQDLMRPNFARTIYWNQFGADGNPVPIQVETYRDDTVASDVHRARHFTDEKLTAAAAGFLITDVLGVAG